MGHKNIETTLIYTQLVNFNEEEEYTCKTATNIKEATNLLENGFEYNQHTSPNLRNTAPKFL